MEKQCTEIVINDTPNGNTEKIYEDEIIDWEKYLQKRGKNDEHLQQYV